MRNLISIVDDDDSVRRTTALLVSSFGFQAVTFESAEGFLASGRLGETSCLILDVRMAGMNGLQLQKRLAAEGHGIPIIFVTAHENTESRQRALEAGAVAFLSKPFSDDVLFETIQVALGGAVGTSTNLVSIVDDDESVRRTTALLIESFGFRAAAFESAEDFLRSSKLEETSCLIVDMRMPGTNGLQLQSHLAATGRTIPIIFITAYDDKERRERALQAGAVAFLAKPFDDDLLLQTVRKALQHANSDVKIT